MQKDEFIGRLRERRIPKYEGNGMRKGPKFREIILLEGKSLLIVS